MNTDREAIRPLSQIRAHLLESVADPRPFKFPSAFLSHRIRITDSQVKIPALKYLKSISAAFVLLGAAVFGVAQQPEGTKHNARPEVATPTPAPVRTVNQDSNSTNFTYEFTQPEFYVRRITIEHDADGRGRLTFERMRQETPVVEPLEFSTTTLARVSGLWRSLNFLESKEDYQSEKQFPHLGSMRLTMDQKGSERTAEFNWSKNKDAFDLVSEYRRIADQAILLFDISVARETRPLDAPKLMEELESLFKRNALTDPKQLLPLLRDITSDEHLPLIARNHAARLIKKIEK